MSPDPVRIYDDLTLEDNVYRARLFSEVAHMGQPDKAGRNYFVNHISHTISMFERRARMFPIEVEANLDDDDAKITKIALYLHDTLEDTPVTQRMLIDLGFPARAVSIVDLMTRRKSVPKHIYYSKIRKEPEARFGKAADMDSNTQWSRLEMLPREDQERLLEKYIDGFERIEMTPLWDLPKMLATVRQARANAEASA